MNEILAQLIASAIDAKKIPGLDAFDMTVRANGEFIIILIDGNRIKVSVDLMETEP